MQALFKLNSPAGPRCAVIVATQRWQDLLRTVSLPSIGGQICPPALLVLVADGCAITPEDAGEFADILGQIEFVVLNNRRAAGAAGAWNTGLDYLLTSNFDGFVAFLDDDDEWDADHLAVNLSTARQTGASVVISGLRFMRDGVARERDLPQGLTDRIFFTGNPGWQGSNTFASIKTLATVGGFRDGLASCNDRDLAIRLLRQRDVRTAYTGKWTATWHQSSKRQTLSSPSSESKLRGLRWFWQIYGSEMQPAEADEFFTRASGFFGIGRDEIILATNDRPPHCEPRGDLRR